MPNQRFTIRLPGSDSTEPDPAGDPGPYCGEACLGGLTLVAEERPDVVASIARDLGTA